MDTGHLTANFVFVFYYYTALSVSQSKAGARTGLFFSFSFLLASILFFEKKRKREMGKKRSVAGEAKTSRSHEVGVLKTAKCFNNGLPPRNPQGLFFF